MKNSLKRLRGFAVHKRDAKNIQDHQPYGAQSDELNRAWQVSVAAITPKRFPLHLVTETNFPNKVDGKWRSLLCFVFAPFSLLPSVLIFH